MDIPIQILPRHMVKVCHGGRAEMMEMVSQLLPSWFSGRLCLGVEEALVTQQEAAIKEGWLICSMAEPGPQG